MLLGAKGQSLGNAIEEVIAAKRLANSRESYVAELGRYLRKFAMGRAEMDVAVFSPKVIEKWFAGRSDTAHGRATGINRLSTLFDFCWRKKWIAENPCTRLERVHLEYGIPKLLSVDECERLMHAAERLDATLLPRLSLMLFAGV